ncbi:hypothetical protein D3C81_1800220 [compost metagenome]
MERGQQRQRATFGHVERRAVAQQHRQVIGSGDASARADQGREKAVAELPLRDFLSALAQVVQQIVKLLEFVGRQGGGFGHGAGSRGAGPVITWGCGGHIAAKYSAAPFAGVPPYDLQDQANDR